MKIIYVLTVALLLSGLAYAQAGMVVNNTVNCATSADGSVVGIGNPLQKTQVSPSFTGTLSSGNYYVKYSFYDFTGKETLPSPEIVAQLNSTGRLTVAIPTAGLPAGAAGMRVYISTTPGAETLQGSSIGNASFVQSVPLVSGTALPQVNTTLCRIVANDAGWPTGTGYATTVIDKNGNTLPGYPMQSQLMGPGSTIDVSSGLPGYHGIVMYPAPILASPLNHGTQSINGPLSVQSLTCTGFPCGSAGSVMASSFPGSTADVQISSAIAYACSVGPRSVTLFGLTNATIASTVSLGCSDGTPLEVTFDPSFKFVPAAISTVMFHPLPSVTISGTAAVDVSSVSGYSAAVVKLYGQKYNNQLGDITNAKGVTDIGNWSILGPGTGTCFEFDGNSSTEYVEFVSAGRLSCVHTQYGLHMISSNHGFVNSNRIYYLQCGVTQYCWTLETTDANGSESGNVILHYDDEYGSSILTPQGLKSIWFKGTGSERDNKSYGVNMWDWPDPGSVFTVYVDGTLGSNAGNEVWGGVDDNIVYDPGVTLFINDSLTGTWMGNQHNTNGVLEWPQVRATNSAQGYYLGTSPIIFGDANSVVIESQTASGSVTIKGAQTTVGMSGASTGTLTSGDMYDGYQDTSTFTGTGLHLDYAHGSGAFSGNFVNFLNNTVSEFSVDSSGNTSVGGGSTIVYRCATSGALPAGALTITGASCGTTADTGLRVK